LLQIANSIHYSRKAIDFAGLVALKDLKNFSMVSYSNAAFLSTTVIDN
jgi:hypothetical protein